MFGVLSAKQEQIYTKQASLSGRTDILSKMRLDSVIASNYQALFEVVPTMQDSGKSWTDFTGRTISTF